MGRGERGRPEGRLANHFLGVYHVHGARIRQGEYIAGFDG